MTEPLRRDAARLATPRAVVLALGIALAAAAMPTRAQSDASGLAGTDARAAADAETATGTERDRAVAAEPVDAGGQANIVADAAHHARPRCVKIYGAGIGREHGYATGVLVSEAGHILTAQGVYLAGARLRAVTADGRVHQARVLRRDDGLQVALLKIDAQTPEYFEIADDPLVQAGDWIVAVSNAFNVADAGEEPLSVTLGVASLRGKLQTRKRAIEFDVAAEVLLVDAIVSNPGAPGGAVVAPDGRLAGMIGKILEAQTTNTRLNYAIPNDLLADFLQGESFEADAQPQGEPGEAYLGIRIFKLSGRKAPAYIDRVDRDSPAAEAGLENDDLILQIDDQWIRSVEDYQVFLEEVRPGEKLQITFKRGRDVMIATLTTAKDD